MRAITPKVRFGLLFVPLTHLIGSMIDYQVQHKFHSPLMETVDHTGNIVHCAIGLMDSEIVGDVVSLIIST